MRSESPSLLRRAGPPVVALLVGVGCGWGFREATAARTLPTSEHSANRSNAASTNTSRTDLTEAPSKKAREPRIGFSSQQWSKFVRNPALFRVTLVEFLPDTEDPVEEGDAPWGSSSGIELEQVAGLLGWDEVRKEKVKDELLAFGRDLAEAEKKGAQIEYPEVGVIRFDLSSSNAERQALFAKLGISLTRVLGEEEAGRFSRISGIEGLASDLSDHYQITARYDGNDLRVEAPGVVEQVESRKPATPDHFSAARMRGFDRRVRHLGLEIDWSRLALEPGSANPQSR